MGNVTDLAKYEVFIFIIFFYTNRFVKNSNIEISELPSSINI